MTETYDAELVLDARAELGEGALWDTGRGVLYWVDITGMSVHIWDPRTGKDRGFAIGQIVGTVVPCVKGDLLLAIHHGIARFDPETGKVTVIADPERDTPSHRFNDGKADPAGRFWAGTMEMSGKAGEGTLYCLEPGGALRPMLRGVAVSNGIVWSADERTMYYIDTPTYEISAFDYDKSTGSITNRRAVVRIPREMGMPDGMAIDVTGTLWVAMYGGHGVTRWDPRSGKHLSTWKVPVTNAASCAFGGPGMDELYVTTARLGLDPAALAREPQAGAIYRFRPGVRGVAMHAFAG